MRPAGRLGLFAVTAGALLAASGAAHAQEPYYKGKTIRLIISVGVAGGFAEYARTMIMHMGKHIPGNPNMIMQSMPGAGGIIATNHMYVQAPADGTVIAMINATAPLAPLWGSKGARFDALKFNWIGALDRSDGTCAFWHTAPAKTWDDLKKNEVTVGSIGAGSPMEVYATMLNKLFGTRIKIIGGYTAGSDIDLAMQRQEIDGRCGTHLKSIPALHPDWITGNKLLVPILVSDKRNKSYPNTPALMEFVKDDATRQTIELLTVTQKLDRPILAPPKTPAAQVAQLRAGLAATVRDPAFIADLKKKRLTLDPTSGEEAVKIYTAAYASPRPVVEAVKAMMGTRERKKKGK
ncbi:MAG: Bug family tripartite tricarboxylate transporter substrate binding protein [Xanthobacteraceae bacterium]